MTVLIHDVYKGVEKEFGTIPHIQPETPIIDLEYADDTLLLGRSTKLINTTLHCIETHAETNAN